MSKPIQKIAPHLWFVKGAQEAATFYASIFPDSRVTRVSPLPAESPSGPAGSVDLVEFSCSARTSWRSAPAARSVQSRDLVHRELR